MNPDYKDIEITCLGCNELFLWTSGEQVFLNDLKEKGKIPSVIQPKRCASCRRKKKEERERLENQNY